LRDAFVLVFSLFLAFAGWMQLGVEPVFAMLFAVGLFLAVLSVIDMALLARKTKRKGFFYFNCIVQLPISFIVAGLGAFVLPFAFIGLLFLALNIAIIVMLKREKKPKAS